MRPLSTEVWALLYCTQYLVCSMHRGTEFSAIQQKMYSHIKVVDGAHQCIIIKN